MILQKNIYHVVSSNCFCLPSSILCQVCTLTWWLQYNNLCVILSNHMPLSFICFFIFFNYVFFCSFEFLFKFLLDSTCKVWSGLFCFYVCSGSSICCLLAEESVRGKREGFCRSIRKGNSCIVSIAFSVRYLNCFLLFEMIKVDRYDCIASF